MAENHQHSNEQSNDNLYQKITANEIRLLRIARNQARQINCSLEVHSMRNDRLRYVAVSYTWGPPRDPDFMRDGDATDSPDNEYRIQVNGHAFIVKENLHGLLQMLANERSDEMYWIDAICINQSDNAEKAIVVQEMGKVYGQASRVFVWLGPADADTPRAVKLLKDFAWHTHKLDQKRHVFLWSAAQKSEGQRAFYDSIARDVSADDWRILMGLLHRRWFSRVWTVQEAAMPSHEKLHCRCGNFAIPFESFLWIDIMFKNTWAGRQLLRLATQSLQGKQLKSNPSIYYHAKRMAEGNGDSADDRGFWQAINGDPRPYAGFGGLLLSLYALQTSMHATDPRDRVFASLGLLQHMGEKFIGKPLALKADYTKAANQVFLETTSFIINNTGKLMSLPFAVGPAVAGTQALPSWAIDFAAQPRDTLMKLLASESGQPSITPYDASQGSDMGFELRGMALKVYSKKIAKVTHIGASLEEMQKSPQICAALVLQSLRPGVSVEAQVNQLRRTMCCDLQWQNAVESRDAFNAYVVLVIIKAFSDTRSKAGGYRDLAELEHVFSLADKGASMSFPTRSQIEKIFADIQQNYDFVMNELTANEREMLRSQAYSHISSTSWADTAREAVVSKLAETARSFDSYISVTMFRRRLFLLDNGRFGLGPEGIAVGDELHLISGCKTPFILRNKTDAVHPDTRTLVGEAFVLDYMYGKAMKEVGAQSWKEVCIL